MRGQAVRHVRGERKSRSWDIRGRRREQGWEERNTTKQNKKEKDKVNRRESIYERDIDRDSILN